ncbi:MAG: substrate-binding domain-containing protein [Bacillota bacterium]|nr:substrate-binding domain-containing protein [Bacillota bacterium]MDW7676991.1 substrate-binding domain-containing protein [Bacillota bacterium]
MTDKRKEAFQILLAIDGKRSFSVDRLFALLELIQGTGSISKAAADLGASYRYAWGLIQDGEKELGIDLVIRQAGGAEGGGTTLTDAGRRLLDHYRSLKQEIDSQLADLLAPQEAEGQSSRYENQIHQREHFLLLASTIGPVETGLMELLEQAYFTECGVLVRHIAAGSGRALDIARMGRVDLALVHAPDLEEAFLNEGFGSERIPLMSNRFYLVGPCDDPAGLQYIREEAGVAGLFRQIALTQQLFVSRGDRSGTHLREQEIWEQSGMTPVSPWYITSPGVVGNRGALALASEQQAYTFIDSATFWQAQCGEAVTVYAGESMADPLLLNQFSLLLLNPKRFAAANHADARAFADWLTNGSGRQIIAVFGKEYGGEAFFAAAGGTA